MHCRPGIFPGFFFTQKNLKNYYIFKFYNSIVDYIRNFLF
jgi:hypothetical protein